MTGRFTNTENYHQTGGGNEKQKAAEKSRLNPSTSSMMTMTNNSATNI